MPSRIDIRPTPDAQRVDVTVDDAPFTAYIWPDTLTKPVLYPLRTARGTVVTRGFPFDPQPGEREDHPHHVGLWLTYGDVNGLDFWGNSNAIAPEHRSAFGTIRHRSVDEVACDSARATLAVTAEWVRADGHPLLRETTRFVFAAEADTRQIDRIAVLTAQEDVMCPDDKEGMLGVRVARQLEHPSTTPEVFTDNQGNPTEVAALSNTGVTGLYRSSEGVEGDAVWGTRANWVKLGGRIGDESISLVIFDHPQNPGYPTYWHARGYGLFAANPLGQKALSGGKDELNFALQKGASATFRHRITIDSDDVGDDALNARFREFAGNP